MNKVNLNLTKRMHIIHNQFNLTRMYDIDEAISFIKKFAIAKFIESIDIAIRLGIDTSKSDQNIRGAIILPHGIGRQMRVAVFAEGTAAESAKNAGADLIGMTDLVNHIKKGNLNFDIVITTPETMRIISPLGPILGPRGLMPNIKFGTVTNNLSAAVKNFKFGQIRCRNDKYGIVHTTIGKANFTSIQLKENLESLIVGIKKLRPISSKGMYIKKISLSSTMGIGITINKSSLGSIVC